MPRSIGRGRSRSSGQGHYDTLGPVDWHISEIWLRGQYFPKLIACTLSELLIAVYKAITGGAWDNAKKSIEDDSNGFTLSLLFSFSRW